MALIYNASFDSQTRVLSLLDKAGNVISSCEVPSKELVDDPSKPLMLRAIADNSSVMLNKNGTLSNTYQTSTDGKNWTDYTLGTRISLNKGESVYFRCNNHPTTQSTSNYVRFHMLGEIEAWHNAYSMISSSFTDTSASVGSYGMFILFHSCEGLTKAPLLLNALAEHCYDGLFYYCLSLKQAPSLPATTLADGCYDGMFTGCRALKQAPSLPATTLAEGCYYRMFSGCQSLKEVRVSATTTAPNALSDWLKDVSATGDFYCDPNATIFPTDSASGIPKGWNRRDINLLNALTLTATADNSSVKLTKNGTLDNTFEVDTGNGWTAYEFDTVIPLNAGQSCKWRCSAHPTTQSYSNYVKFVMTGTIEASGNVNSMILGGFENLTSLSGYDYAFYQLFNGCSSLTQAPNLPATTLATYCYGGLFSGCRALTKAPNLPATTLAKGCYQAMFKGCTSLTSAPQLPATTLANDCYSAMFKGCTSLTSAPQLSATTLAPYCCSNMFNGCTSLTQAPSLPVTTVANFCYSAMFNGCTSLTSAPQLPATTLADSCYRQMFKDCTALNEVRVSATTTAQNALDNWLSGVSSTGDFYCDPNATIFPTNSVSGIPSGWTRLPLSDYPNP